MEANPKVPEPRKVEVWAEGTHVETRELIIPKKSPDSSDDIPTIPDLDDFQDILEKEIAVPPILSHKDVETVNTLAEVGSGFTGSVESIDAALDVLKLHIPQVEDDNSDTVWTVESLLSQFADEQRDHSS